MLYPILHPHVASRNLRKRDCFAKFEIFVCRLICLGSWICVEVREGPETRLGLNGAIVGMVFNYTGMNPF